MNQQLFEDILEHGNGGEVIGGVRYITDTPPPMSYGGVLIMAKRYLLPGPDTYALRDMNIDWGSWATKEHSQGPLPDLWWIMPKGLLLNYFRQRGEKLDD